MTFHFFTVQLVASVSCAAVLGIRVIVGKR